MRPDEALARDLLLAETMLGNLRGARDEHAWALELLEREHACTPTAQLKAAIRDHREHVANLGVHLRIEERRYRELQATARRGAAGEVPHVR